MFDAKIPHARVVKWVVVVAAAAVVAIRHWPEVGDDYVGAYTGRCNDDLAPAKQTATFSALFINTFSLPPPVPSFFLHDLRIPS